MLNRGKVVLFYPAYDGPPLGAPLCLLALASPLRQANFDVVVIDAAIDPDYRAHIERESADALVPRDLGADRPHDPRRGRDSHGAEEHSSTVTDHLWRLASHSAAG